MKKIILFFLIISPLLSFGQVQIWERFEWYDFEHPWTSWSPYEHYRDLYNIEDLDTSSIEDFGSLGSYKNQYNFQNKIWNLTYTNGFLIVDSINIVSFIFPDSLERSSYFGLEPDTSKPYFLDNGGLIMRFQDYDLNKSYYFSYLSNKIEFIAEKPWIYNNEFFYKNVNGELDYLSYQSGNKLVLIENDTIEIPVLNDFRYAVTYLDSNYLWLYKWRSPKVLLCRMPRSKNYFQGQIFYDFNQNGVLDSNEHGYGDLDLVIKPSGLKITTSSNGGFGFIGKAGVNYYLEIPSDSLFNYTSSSLPFEVFSENENNIGVTLSSPEFSINPNFNLPWPRCGTTRNAYLNVRNSGFTPIEKLKLKLVPDQNTDVFSNHAIDIFGDTLVTEISNLNSGESDMISYAITWPDAELTGEVLDFKLISEIYYGGEVVKTEVDSISTILRCSYDPNDKAVTPAGVGDQKYTLKNSTLSYLIRFENTGNDTAYHVTIKDTLDASLNLNTFKLLGSSHNVVTNLDTKGHLTFYFEDIMLPDSTTNKEAAQGFVRFSIAPSADLTEATVISNSAGIIFDSNLPVITNEVHNTMVTKIPVVTSILPIIKERVFIHPNPASEKLRIDLPIEKVEIYSSVGQLISTVRQNEISLKNLANGVYLFKIYNSEDTLISTERIIVNR